MITLQNICENIELPLETTNAVLKIAEENRFSVNEIYEKLSTEAGTAEFKESLCDDKNGIKMLAYSLIACIKTKELYEKLGISDEIFYETIKCFTRFSAEHKDSFGEYGFDREWWSYRQISLKLFRIGELEYEIATLDNEDVINIHIPSNALLKPDLLHSSYKESYAFFGEFYPDYKYTNYVCETWLLAPALKELLPASSNILAFANDFVIDEVFPDVTDFLQWIYKKMDIPLEELPEETSLQRKLKAHLLSGGKLGEAKGHLKMIFN